MSVAASAFNTSLKQAFRWDFICGLAAFRVEVSRHSNIVHSATVYSYINFIVALDLRTYGISIEVSEHSKIVIVRLYGSD